jgi:hypothetical protein
MTRVNQVGMRRVRRDVVLACLLSVVVLVTWSHPGLAYDRYSVNRDATNCRACHGDFRAAAYVSPVDGQNWGNIHNLHRTTMLNGDCSACHFSSRFPTFIGSSTGGTGLSPIGCLGCHGRAEDNVPGNPEFGAGYGAGLRQRHQIAGVTDCIECHADSDPANYTPVAENVLPPFYANPGTNHPAMPTQSCNANGSENFAGTAEGLDNDGNNIYDTNDVSCATPVETQSWGSIKSLFR